ncbi:hypothetical protein QJS04_geneDACA011940 [Acorus gramineus]|uniref:J domain-containing protein n=1 Tax=Acorus gramineus TaxID=55184 RepID=A0AAV9AIL6_ACOGR|nr:hypothetical protein QJS04_geneDACA011940 [Acorus gramineus]
MKMKEDTCRPLMLVRILLHLRVNVVAAHGINKSSRASSTIRCFHATGLCYAIQRDLYEILGVSKNASQDEIKKAFHAYTMDENQDAGGSMDKYLDKVVQAFSLNNHSRAVL